MVLTLAIGKAARPDLPDGSAEHRIAAHQQAPRTFVLGGCHASVAMMLMHNKLSTTEDTGDTEDQSCTKGFFLCPPRPLWWRVWTSSGGGEFLFQQLLPVQFRVETVVADQLVVRALFNDAALVQNEDLVGIAHRRHTV